MYMYNPASFGTQVKCLDSADQPAVSQLQQGAGGDEHNSLTARSRADHVTGLKTVQFSRISPRLSHGATFFGRERLVSDGRITNIISYPFPPLLATIP